MISSDQRELNMNPAKNQDNACLSLQQLHFSPLGSVTTVFTTTTLWSLHPL